jgi:hypothetical protein
LCDWYESILGSLSLAGPESEMVVVVVEYVHQTETLAVVD